MPQTPGSPVPQEVSTELQRVVERWRQLPLDHALSYADRVRTLVQSLADGVAEAKGIAASVVPDLGPATLMDQLTVMVHDASSVVRPSTADVTTAEPLTAEVSTGAASTVETSTGSPAQRSTLAEDLATLRRQLA